MKPVAGSNRTSRPSELNVTNAALPGSHECSRRMLRSSPCGVSTILPSSQPHSLLGLTPAGIHAGSNASLLLIVQLDALSRSAFSGAETTADLNPEPHTHGSQS